MNQETKPFLVQLESFTSETTLEKKLEELKKELRELELKVSSLEKLEQLKQENRQHENSL